MTSKTIHQFSNGKYRIRQLSNGSCVAEVRCGFIFHKWRAYDLRTPGDYIWEPSHRYYRDCLGSERECLEALAERSGSAVMALWEFDQRRRMIAECVRLRTRTRLHDAHNNTSVDEEIANLLRYHRPFEEMSTVELEAEIAAAKAELEEQGQDLVAS